MLHGSLANWIPWSSPPTMMAINFVRGIGLVSVLVENHVKIKSILTTMYYQPRRQGSHPTCNRIRTLAIKAGSSRCQVFMKKQLWQPSWYSDEVCNKWSVNAPARFLNWYVPTSFKLKFLCISWIFRLQGHKLADHRFRRLSGLTDRAPSAWLLLCSPQSRPISW